MPQNWLVPDSFEIKFDRGKTFAIIENFWLFQNIENFIKDVYKQRYAEDIQEEAVQLLYSVAVSIFAIGGMVGGFSGGIIANRFGR